MKTGAFRLVYEWAVRVADDALGPFDEGHRFVGQRDFRRTLQLNSYTCAPCSVFMVLRHFSVRCGIKAIAKALGTDEDGTTTGAMLRYLRSRGLVARPRDRMTLKDLRETLANGAVAIVSVDGDHVAVAYGLDALHVHLADPAPNRSLSTRVPRRTFLRRWDRDAIVVRLPRRIRTRPRGAAS